MAPAETGTFLAPERIVRYFELEQGDHAADFGAGHGYFTIPMARAVGGNGKVYAIDVQKTVLDIIRSRARLEHLLNIEPLWADLDSPKGIKIKNNFLEFVLIANSLFQSEQKAWVLKEARRMLRERGRLALIEWDQTSSPLGPAPEARIKKEVARKLAEEAGFAFDREFEAGEHHYGLLFKKLKS